MEPVGAFEGTIVVGTYFHPRTCDQPVINNLKFHIFLTFDQYIWEKWPKYAI